jgi:branched-chain amino acid transport system permease protein
VDRSVRHHHRQAQWAVQGEHQVKEEIVRLKEGLAPAVRYLIGIGLAVALLFAFDRFLPGFWLTLFLLFGINTILAVSLNITNGWANLFSIGHGGIMLAGGYAAALFTLPVFFKADIVGLHLPGWILNAQIPFLPALLLGGVVGSLIGIVLALPALRLRGMYFILVTLGFNLIMVTIAENLRNYTNGAMGLRQFPLYTNVWWVWGIAFLLIYIAWMLKRSFIGRAMIARGRDQELAQHMGINLLRYKIYAFGLSTFFTAIGGILWVHLILNLFPNAFGLTLVFHVVVMIVIGGMGSISGAVIGSGIITSFTLVLAPVEEGFVLFGLQVPRMMGLTTLMLSVVLIVILVLKPDGLMGENEFSLQGLRRRLARLKPGS